MAVTLLPGRRRLLARVLDPSRSPRSGARRAHVTQLNESQLGLMVLTSTHGTRWTRTPTQVAEHRRLPVEECGSGVDLGAAPGRRPPGAPQRPHRATATRASICGYAEARITSHTQCWHKSLREIVHEGTQQR